MNTKTTLCQTPSKLILSGEHAVVYGAPALTVALDLLTQCELSFRPANSTRFQILLPNFNQTHQLSFDEAQQQAQQIEQGYQAFLNHTRPIEEVLQQPLDLILCTLFLFHRHQPLQTGQWTIQIQSHQHTSKGLGSSASVIVSLLHSLYEQHLGQPLKARPDLEQAMLELAWEIECRQHGQSSGLDTTAVYYGGLMLYQNGKVRQKMAATQFKGQLLDSGRPLSTTGQVVAAVAKWYQTQQTEHTPYQTIWHDFEQTTRQLFAAWQANNLEQVLKLIRQNQSLLTQIGVVPNAVNQTLQPINQQTQAAAKICGAGSLTGEQAGMVLLLGEPAAQPTYPSIPFQFNNTGSHCVTLS